VIYWPVLEVVFWCGGGLAWAMISSAFLSNEWVRTFVPAVEVDPDRGLEVFDAVESGTAD
jgi:hypothetical protein